MQVIIVANSQKRFFFWHIEDSGEDGTARDVWTKQAITQKTSSCQGTENGEKLSTIGR